MILSAFYSRRSKFVAGTGTVPAVVILFSNSGVQPVLNQKLLILHVMLWLCFFADSKKCLSVAVKICCSFVSDGRQY